MARTRPFAMPCLARAPTDSHTAACIRARDCALDVIRYRGEITVTACGQKFIWSRHSPERPEGFPAIILSFVHILRETPELARTVSTRSSISFALQNRQTKKFGTSFTVTAERGLPTGDDEGVAHSAQSGLSCSCSAQRHQFDEVQESRVHANSLRY